MNQNVYDALCFVLWHHQGGSSVIGQPIRKMLDIGQHDYMNKTDLDAAKRVQLALNAQSKPLSDEEIILIVAECASSHQHTDIHFARAIEAAIWEKQK